jgi:small subunit ribosomal protein S16
MRLGKIRAPYYRIVVADSRTKREGRVIETIGKYHPKQDPSLIEVDSERARYWLSVGAQPTEPVAAILKLTGDWQAHAGEPAPSQGVRTAAPRADRKAAFEAAAKETLDAADKPAKKTAAKKTTAKKAAEKPAAEKPAEAHAEAVTEDKPAEDKAEDQPAEAQAEAAPAEDKPAEEAPAEAEAEAAPAEDQPAEDQPAEAEAPAEDKAAE